ncbi:MAG: CHAD domain-containing protein [Anaerolineaceae bacterium]|nr:CHAD domain-containing protein [Anaerolineaceae bacterium]
MKPKLDQSTRLFGAGMLLKYLSAMRVEMDGVRQAQDIEAIHRMRVASRRMRTAMSLFEVYLPKRKRIIWQKLIQKTTRSLGAARDTDVQIEILKEYIIKAPSSGLKTGIRRLLLRWRQKRTKLQENVNCSIDELVKNNILDEFQQYLEPLVQQKEQEFVITLDLFKLALESISGRLNEFLSYEEIIYQPENIEELHQMRIAAKWLRYSLETFAPLYTDELKEYIQIIREVQDVLGEIHDCDVWAKILPEFLQKETRRTIAYYGNASQVKVLTEGILYFQQTRQDERNRLYQVYLDKWANWKNVDLWNRLMNILMVPLQITAHIYPPAPAPNQSTADPT